MDDVLERAAAVLARGGLVAFPTETVYGLGAGAGDEAALRRLYRVKGRPSSHPVIVHLPDATAMADWAARVSEAGRTLAERFWPGPLTLIVEKRRHVSPLLTGGQATVGLRVPDHPLARSLIRAAGPLAAPSANRYGAVSPTCAAHVALDLGDEIDLIVDGGPCRVGVESTIVDITGPPRVLRPGGVTREALEDALLIEVPTALQRSIRTPGDRTSHYAPRAEVMLSTEADVDARVEEAQREGKRVVVLAQRAHGRQAPVPTLDLGQSPAEAAARLYAALREVDRQRFDLALVIAPPEVGIGIAIRDRLTRAAAPRLGAPALTAAAAKADR